MHTPSRDTRSTHPALTRRAACAFGASLAASLLGACADELIEPPTTGDDDEPDQPAIVGMPVSAHQAAVSDNDATYFVDFSRGALVRTDLVNMEDLYVNGQANYAGIRYLVCDSSTIYFGDVPSGEVRSVATTGGEVRTVVAAKEGSTAMPVAIADGRLFVSRLDNESLVSTIESVSLANASTGTEATEITTHLTLPDNFYAHCVHADERIYYSGVTTEDTREIRSATLDGTDERTLFVLDDAPSAQTALFWQTKDETLYVEAQDDANLSNRLMSVSLVKAEDAGDTGEDGVPEAELVHDFSTQKVLFDMSQDGFVFLDRDSFALLTASSNTDDVSQLAEIPHEAQTTSAVFLEAGDGVVWATTLTANDNDTAASYVTYHVDRESGEVIRLVPGAAE